MTRFKSLRSTVCVAAIAIGSTATADVTAQDVWKSLKDQLSTGSEATISGSETMSGNTLTVTDLEVDMSDDEADVTFDMGDLTFTENGDGTVTLHMDEQVVITFSPPGKADANRIVVLLKMAGAQTVVSGVPGDMLYTTTADRYTISIDEAIEDGDEIPVEFTLNLNNISSKQSMITADGLLRMAGDFAADSLDMLMAVEDDGSTVDVSGQATGILMNASVAVPEDMDAANADRAFLDGMSVEFTSSVGTSAFLAFVDEGMGPMNVTSTSTNGTLSMMIDKDVMTFDGGAQNMALAMSGGTLPFPVNVGLASYGYSFGMPMSKTEEPAPFNLSVNLTELAINDDVWMMADPAGVLPHDPMTFQATLSGTGKLYYDLADPAQADAADAAEVPGELNSLTLENLLVVALGATITGAGSFIFDNTDLVSFDGMPAPEGSVTFDAIGLNGLLDKLGTMGLIPEDQLMGGRMMMGMFANVVGDDHLTSKVEVTEEGSVFINGMQIK